MPGAAPSAARLEALLESLAKRHGFERLDQAGFDAFAQGPGERLVLLTEDPVRNPESWDLAVILPEIAALAARPVQVGMLPAPQSRAVCLAHGVRAWPALLFLRDGRPLGAIEGLRDWAEFAREVPQMLERAPAARGAAVIPIAPAPRACC
jgi:hydrogenase-1 operon protein HyaE